MRIHEFMSSPVDAVPPATPLDVLARHMREAGVGSVLVTDDERVVGIVTDRDLVLRGLAAGLSPDTRVEAVMSTDLVTVAVDADVDAAYDALRRHAVRRLPVLDGDRVVGMVTIDDLLLRLRERFNALLGPVAEELIDPDHGQRVPVPRPVHALDGPGRVVE